MSSNNLLAALAEDNQTEIARLFPTQEFTLIELTEESDTEGTAALTAEVEDYLVLVAFTASGFVEQFGDKVPDMFESGEIPGFTLNGTEMLSFLPEDF